MTCRPLGDHRTFGYERCGGIGYFKIGTIDHVVVSFGDGQRVGGRGQIGHVNRAADEGREGLGVAAGLNEIKRRVGRIHAETPQRLNRKVVRVAADPADADLFAAQILGAS